MLRKQYSVTREDMSPMKDLNAGDAIADNIKYNERAFDKIHDQILEKQRKQRNKAAKISRKIEKNIKYQGFSQEQTKDFCCFSPLKVEKSVLPDEVVSTSFRTRTILQESHQQLQTLGARHNSMMQNYSNRLSNEAINHVRTSSALGAPQNDSLAILTNLQSIDTTNNYNISKNFSGRTK